MSSRLVLTAILALGLSTSVDAQNPYVRNPRNWDRGTSTGRQPVIVQPAEVQGTIEGVMRGVVVVLDANNRPWHVAMQAAKVQVTGSANADYLQTGMTVELKADVDAHGAVKEKVGDLKIVTPSADNAPGLFPPDSGADAATEASGSKAGKPAKHATASKGPKAGALTAGTYRIVGRLIVGPGGKLTVKAGRHQVSLELNDQPKIDVELGDLSMVAKGDKLSAKGFKATPVGGTAVGQFKASEVKIELAEPLTGTKKKGAASRSDAKRPAKHGTPEDGQHAEQ